ncbi:MAG: hypothetical protein ACFFEA_10405 [Candidatus Thorarchaeota archaeon]
MGQGTKGGIGADTDACPIPPLPSRRDRYPWSLRTFTMSVGFSVLIFSNLLLITVPPLIIPLALPIPQAPPGTNLFLAKTNTSGNLEWSHSFGGFDRDLGHTVIECYDGGFAVAGSTHSYGEGSSDLWLLRTNGTGHPIWNKSYGGTGWDECFDLVECYDGGFAIVGETLSFGNGKEVILIKTDILGNEMWMNTFGGPEDDRGSSIVRCSDGGYAISATTSSFCAGSSDMWLIRTDRHGQLMWNKTFGGLYEDVANSVLLCNDGGFLLVGKTQIAEYDSGTLFLVRLDVNGNQIWNESYIGSSYYGEGWSAVECSDGGFGVIGSMHTAWLSDFDDIWFLRFDSDGRIQWTRKHGGAEISIALGGYSVIECDDMGFVIAGKFGDQSSQTDIWLCRTDASGVVLWATNIRGIHSGSGFLLGGCSDGGYVITGAVETPAESVVVELASNSIFNNGIIDGRRNWAFPEIVTREYKA